MKGGVDHSTRGDFNPQNEHFKLYRSGSRLGSQANTMTSEDEAWIEVVGWLSKLRLLQGVPFVYIVPTEEMLPNESIRFYHMDRNWLDALVDGAISVGTLDSRGALPEVDGDNQEVKYRRLIQELNYSEVQNNPFRNELLEFETSDHGACNHSQGHCIAESKNEYSFGGSTTGFLLRSTVVRDFPGLEVSAYEAPGVDSENSELWASSDKKIQTIHQVRLSETILFCIFNGVPTHLRLQEPAEGIRLGLDPHNPPLDDPIDSSKEIKNRYTLKFKDRDGYLAEIGNEYVVSDIRYRRYTDDRSVIDIKQILDKTLDIEAGHPNLGPPGGWLSIISQFTNLMSGGLVATQLMQFPYQQDFGYDSITQHPYGKIDPQTATVEQSDILSVSQAENEDNRYERSGGGQ